jgi:glycosyltransferase involved in cell wall biosynthesis
MENNKNVWIINHYAFPYGYGFHTRQHTIAKMLKKLGYKITVFTSSFNHLKIKDTDFVDAYKEEVHDEIKYVWIKTSKYTGNGFGRIKNIFSFSKNLNEVFKQFMDKPDVIWISSPQPFSIYNALKMKKYYKSKLIYEERDIWPLTLQVLNGISRYNPLSIIFRYLQLLAYKYSDIIVSPLDNLKEFIEKSGYKNKKVEVLPQPFVKFELEKYDTDLPKNKFIIGYIGSIGHSNSILNLIKAANLLRNNENIYFVIVGDGPQLQEVKEFVKINNLTNVQLIGKLKKEKAMYVLSKCDVLYKGNPNLELYRYGIASVKLAEYMWFDKPIIHATNIENEPISTSNSGLSILPENEIELKNAILKLKEDKELYKSFSKNGKSFVEENLLEDKILVKLKNIMDDL